MIHIYPWGKRWVVDYEFHNLASSWGKGRESFDSWEEVMMFLTKIHNKEARIRFRMKVYDFLGIR